MALKANLATLKEEAQAERLAQQTAQIRAAYAGDEHELGQLIILTNEVPAPFPAGFGRAISLANFGEAFQSEMRALLEPVNHQTKGI